MYNSSFANRFSVLLKRELSILLKQSSTYISFFLLTIITGIYFFVFNGFFINQTVDLKYYFSIFPYISIVALPCLSFNIFKDEGIFNSIAVNDFTKIFIKWLSCFIIFTLSIFVGITTPILVNQFGNIEVAQILTGYLSILFYGASIISLSIFIQIIFKNKIASLIITILILFIFNSIHIIPNHIKINNSVVAFLENFSFAWHYDSASKGIFNTKDFSFYFFVGILFLYLASCFCKKSKGYKFNFQNKIILLILLFLLLDTSLFYKKIDLTKNKKYSVTQETEKIIKELSKPINITYAYSPELANINSQISEIKDFLTLYSNLSSNINLYFEKVTSQNDVAKKLQNFEIQPLQIETENSLNQNYTSVYSSIILETSDNYKTIPFTYNTNMLEYLLTSNILALETNKTQSVIVYAGNNLSLEDEYLDIVEWLKYSGFLVFTDIKISQLQNTSIEIPLLLLGTSELTIEDCHEIENQFFAGRKILVTTSPNSFNINTDWLIDEEKQQDNFINMLSYWGINIDNNLVLDKSCYQIKLHASEYSTDYKILDYPFWLKTNSGIYFWTSPITYETNKNFSAKILQQSSAESWLKNIINEDDNFINTSPLNEKNNQPDLRTQGKYNLACEFSGTFNGYFNSKSKENKIVIIGNQYFASKMISFTNRFENLNYVSDLILDLTEKEFLSNLKNKSADNFGFTKILDDIQLNYLMGLSILVTIITPIFIFIIFILVRKIIKDKK